MDFPQYPAIVNKSPVPAVITVPVFSERKILFPRDNSVKIEERGRVTLLVPCLCSCQKLAIAIKIPAGVSELFSAHTGNSLYEPHAVFIVLSCLEDEAEISVFHRGLILVIHISINEIDAIIGLKDDLVPCLDCQNAKQKKDGHEDGKGCLIFPGKSLT